MASSTTLKTFCFTCDNKGIGIFKCEGCGQTFCRKHANEHRDILSGQLDEIVVEFDVVQQAIAENKNILNHHPLMQEIDKWEVESMRKIRQTANEIRQQLNASFDISQGVISKNFNELAERLRTAHQQDDYVETDLTTWTSKLKELKNDVSAFPFLGYICEDATNTFISRIYISDTKPLPLSAEQFGEISGNISIVDNGRVAVYSGPHRLGAYVRGRTEYSRGKHQIQFIMAKKNVSFVMSFNIVSTSIPISRTLYTGKRVIYGWHTDDGVNNPNNNYQPKKSFKDFRGELTFQVQLIIDCDNRKISYFNQETTNTHEMDVNIAICPFPWQLEFYLFDIGDRIELISSSSIF